MLFCDTSFTAQAVVKIYLDLYEKHAEQILNTSVQLEDVVSTIELLVSDLPECSRLLSIAPQYEKQQVLTNLSSANSSFNSTYYFDYRKPMTLS
mgnify:FL=1